MNLSMRKLVALLCGLGLATVPVLESRAQTGSTGPDTRPVNPTGNPGQPTITTATPAKTPPKKKAKKTKKKSPEGNPTGNVKGSNTPPPPKN
jgi:hypothetical protein